MVTFKSNDFCFTLNRDAVSYILSGKSSIKESEKDAVNLVYKDYFNSKRKSLFTSNTEERINGAKDLTEAQLACTLISIVTNGGSIDLSTRELLHIIDRLYESDSDIYSYIAVSDFVDYIEYKLSEVECGCVDFEDDKELTKFEEFCKSNVTKRKTFIAKNLLIKETDVIRTSDYLVYFYYNNGNYINEK